MLIYLTISINKMQFVIEQHALTECKCAVPEAISNVFLCKTSFHGYVLSRFLEKVTVITEIIYVSF